jgi:hypothetical protein
MVATAPQPAPATAADWPEPDAPSSRGQAQATADVKRKRRRRKGKGQSIHAQAATTTEETQAANAPSEVPAAELPKPPRTPQPAPHQHVTRGKIDPEILARKAWKIFLAEVSEEGIALIGDQDARELARRCFRLAEIFIEEQSRHPGA